jgi:hypothetical protein
MVAHNLLNFDQVTVRDGKEVTVRSGWKYAEDQSSNDHDHRYFQAKIGVWVWPQSIEFRAGLSSLMLT